MNLSRLSFKLFYIFATLFAFLCLGFIHPKAIFAQDDSDSPAALYYEGRVKRVIEEFQNDVGGYNQQLEVEISNKDLQGEVFVVENGTVASPVTQKYRSGDGVVLTGYKEVDGEVHFFVSDYIRRGSLLSLFVIFIVVSILVAGKRGITSLIGMTITFFIIFSLVLPKISAGSPPVLIILLFSAIAIPLTFYLSHGISKKTNVAIAGTFVAMIVTVLLAGIYVNTAKLTGFTNDEASFLQLTKDASFSMRGLLLAGIIVGVLGVLDDITVSQSAIVFQLKNTNRRLTTGELFYRAMEIGKDHIASMINTLILVYAGASLPLLLLFTDSSLSFSEVINYEIIASEVVRTLVGSIGLVLAVPITTVIAAVMADASEYAERL